MAQLVGNRYELVEKIGAGGMGTVYRGIDGTTGQTVAVKQLKSEISAPEMIERFKREGQALATLNHPNIVRYIDTFQAEDTHYLVMEFVSGGSLADLLNRQGKLNAEQVTKIALELADALARSHHLKIIHRDIKPGNVMLAEDGTPRLADFGIARQGNSQISEDDVLAGTPAYLSPELILGESPSPQSDIWAFGIMLVEMLSGKLPFQGEQFGALINGILNTPVPDLELLCPNVSPALLDLIYRMLEKDPIARIPSVRYIGTVLEDIVQGRPVTTPISTRTAITPSQTLQLPHSGTHLPKYSVPFVGRENEIDELLRLLTQDKVRLITIVGVGGMGKTRLSIETAFRLSKTYKSGIVFVDLTPISTPAQVLTQIADAVGYQFQNDKRSQSQQLLDYFSEKEMLLLIDNWEHVLSEAIFISDLINHTSGIKILATSRERLNLDGEQLFSLGGLEFPAWQTPDDALEFAAVKLFVNSAHRIKPAYELTSDDRPHLARITQLVAGMPLALIMAAGWLELLSLREIADEISHNLELLETERRDIPERQRSIRVVFEYAWKQLTTDEQNVFARLSVFRGGFTREAAQTVAGASLRHLLTLTNKSLLRRTQSNGRYEIHELLRQFGEQNLSNLRQTESAHAAHSAYFLKWVADLQGNVTGTRIASAFEVLHIDIENVREASLWAAQHGHYSSLQSSFRSIFIYLKLRDQSEGAWNHLKTQANALRSNLPTSERKLTLVLLLAYSVWLDPLRRTVAELDTLSEEISTLMDGMENIPPLVQAMILQIQDAMNTLRRQNRQDNLKHMVELFKAAGDEWAEIEALSALSGSYWVLREASPAEYEIAYEVAEQAYQRAKGRGFLSLVAGAALRAATALESKGSWASPPDPTLVMQYFMESQRIAEAIGTNSLLHSITHNLGLFYINIGQIKEGVTILERNIVHHNETGNRYSEVSALSSLALAHTSLGLWAQAEQIFAKAAAKAELYGLQQINSFVYMFRAWNAGCWGEFALAERLIRHVLTIGQATDTPSLILFSQVALLHIYAVMDRLDEARTIEAVLKELTAKEGFQGIFSMYETAMTLFLRADKRFDEALSEARKGVDFLLQENAVYPLTYVMLPAPLYALLLAEHGNLEEARRYLAIALERSHRSCELAVLSTCFMAAMHFFAATKKLNRALALAYFINNEARCDFFNKREAQRLLALVGPQLDSATRQEAIAQAQSYEVYRLYETLREEFPLTL